MLSSQLVPTSVNVRKRSAIRAQELEYQYVLLHERWCLVLVVSCGCWHSYWYSPKLSASTRHVGWCMPDRLSLSSNGDAGARIKHLRGSPDYP